MGEFFFIITTETFQLSFIDKRLFPTRVHHHFTTFHQLTLHRLEKKSIMKLFIILCSLLAMASLAVAAPLNATTTVATGTVEPVGCITFTTFYTVTPTNQHWQVQAIDEIWNIFCSVNALDIPPGAGFSVPCFYPGYSLKVFPTFDLLGPTNFYWYTPDHPTGYSIAGWVPEWTCCSKS
jgi:hypothetical protein